MDDISVMICDDSALMRNLIGRIVDETTGMTVCGKAENGQDLIDKLKTAKPDVILLDIEMPVMTGLQFLKKRNELHLDVPVIILSSVATEGAAVTIECLELGASDFITKPGASVTLKIGDVTNEIIEYIASYGGAYAIMHGKQIPDPEFFSHQIKLKEAERFVLKKKGEEAGKANAFTQKKLQNLFQLQRQMLFLQAGSSLSQSSRLQLFQNAKAVKSKSLQLVFQLVDQMPCAMYLRT